MHPLTAPADQLDALDEGRAAVDLASFRKVRVAGGEARRWLNDLVTTDVASLEHGQARRSLLLDATGHIRADLQVACDEQGFWLFQPPDQSAHIGGALAPYVLSSDVRLDDLTDRHRLTAFPGDTASASALAAATAAPTAATDGTRAFRPSVLGAGRDLLGDRHVSLDQTDEVAAGVLVGAEAVEVWRIRHGRARMGVDFDESSIPAEAGLAATIDAAKGCFLGQESVARVRNLGHPPKLLLHLACEDRLDRGSSVRDGRADVGVVTSAAEGKTGGTVVIASVRWDSRGSALSSAEGAPFRAVGSSD